MCGIVGIIDFNQRVELNVLKNMTDALAYRGPDDAGYCIKPAGDYHLGLGHRRLAILDLSPHGHQPMEFEHLTLIFNGEVYNYKEIRKELEKSGYVFDSNSDTEVILKSFHLWGNKAIDKFNGMFAIAIYNNNIKKLTIVRDRAGVKPLYWYKCKNNILFASELKSFHKHPEFHKEIDRDSLTLYLQYGYIPQPHTIFKNTYKLKAGHILEVDLIDQSIKESPYWDVYDSYNKPKFDVSEEEALTETEKLLKSACEYRMVADVPVGVFLSGGYDSSVVTALLQSDRTKKIKTFSIGFHEKEFNEAHHAKKVANYLGTDHTEYYCTQSDAKRILPKLADIWDEPFADNSVIPTTLVSELARKQVTVSLSADGGDEVFGGYSKYQTSPVLFNKLKSFPYSMGLSLSSRFFKPKIGFADSLYSGFSEKYHKAQELFKATSVVETMKVAQKYFADSELMQILNNDVKVALINTEFCTESKLSSQLNNLDKMMAMDFKTYQLDDILTKVDRATMSVSLEGREPLLDFRLIEYVARLPPELKIKEGQKKYLLKQITHKYIPKEMMDRPKMGFSVPIIDWFSSDLQEYLEYYFEASKLEKQNIFNVKELIEMKNKYLAGHKYLINKVWVLLVFQMWYEKWMSC